MHSIGAAPRPQPRRATARRGGLDLAAIARGADLRALVVADLGQPDHTGRWHCPYPPDHRPDEATLAIYSADDGTPHYRCWSARCGAHGDALDWVVARRGLTVGDAARLLSGGRVGAPIGHAAGTPAAPAPRGKATYATLAAAIAAAERQTGMRHAPDRRWTYQRADGGEAFIVLRFDRINKIGTGKTKNKDYRPAHQIAEGRWVLADPPGPLPLYRLPALLASPDATVWLVEGEMCADAAAHIGLLATTSAHGAAARHVGAGRVPGYHEPEVLDVVDSPDAAAPF